MKNRLFKICLALLLIGHMLMAQGVDISKKQDSLSHTLDQTSDRVKRLEILQELSFLSCDVPQGTYWLRCMLEEARGNKDAEKQDWAIRYLARYYYNEGKLDSLAYYAALSDSIAKETRIYSDNYYDTQLFLGQYLAWEGETERASELATRLYEQAKSSENEYGIICGCETLGIINQRIGRDSVAVDFMTEGIVLLRKMSGQKRFMIQLLSNNIESELKLDRFSDVRGHLEELHRLLDHVLDEDPTFPYNRCSVLMESFYINLYVREGKPADALRHIERVRPDMLEGIDQFVRVQYLFSVASYYQLIHEDELAFKMIEDVFELDPCLEVLKKKADILFNMGRMREAALAFQEALRLNERMNTTHFTHQLSQLHASHEMASLELQVKDLRVMELELDVNRQQLRWTVTLIVILIIILLIGFQLYLHTHKLKNELARDKQSLLESEEKLRIARDQAQESDRVKSLFLSNMSHEIRTPLNAIVGFSQVLESEVEGNPELEEYTKMITGSSSLLLNLVNDILDISRLESEKYRFTFAEENLAECCRETLRSVRHRLNPGVELRFQPGDESFILYTDKLRLQQVLINLVGNATKFTQAGSIELAFEVEKEHGLVRFLVSDTGCGIPPDKQDAIFERFEKLDECVQGTGLGLSICRIIAERFGGEVTLDKEYTGGARFIFTHSLSLRAGEL